MADLGGLPGYPFSSGQCINATGEVAGYCTNGANELAFLYTDGVMTDLGTLPGATQSNATGINDNGQVVGNSGGPFLYSDGVMTNLNSLISPSSGWVLQQANGINDAGQFTGYGTFDGQQEAFLLTPTPEPSTWILATIGVGGLGYWTFRRRRASTRPRLCQ